MGNGRDDLGRLEEDDIAREEAREGRRGWKDQAMAQRLVLWPWISSLMARFWTAFDCRIYEYYAPMVNIQTHFIMLKRGVVNSC